MGDRFCRARAEFASRSDGAQVGTPVVDLQERPPASACGYELRLVRLRPQAVRRRHLQVSLIAVIPAGPQRRWIIASLSRCGATRRTAPIATLATLTPSRA